MITELWYTKKVYHNKSFHFLHSFPLPMTGVSLRPSIRVNPDIRFPIYYLYQLPVILPPQSISLPPAALR